MSIVPQDQNRKENLEHADVDLQPPAGKREASPKKQISPWVLTILGGIGTALLAIFNNWFQWFETQSAETLKLRATLIEKALEPPTAEERKKNLLFLVTAGLITDSGDKIKNLKLEEIPQSFNFVASAALTPELRTRLDNALRDFQHYVETIGLRIDNKPRVAVLNDQEMKVPGALCFYDANATGGPELVINARYANDPDLVLREYCHHVLATNHPGGSPKYEGDPKNYSAHFAIESALAYYLPCSFDNDPQFARKLLQNDSKDIVSINFARARKLTELRGDFQSAYYEDAEVWGSLFWELRTKFGRENIDGLLVQAWFTLAESAPLNTERKAFSETIVQSISQKLGPDAANNAKKIFDARGLSL
jgi:hypothetical protein